MTGQNFTPTVPGAPAIPANLTVTVPSLEDDANILTAFQDYHTSLSWYLNDSVKKTSASAQTISSEVTLSGVTTISGSNLTISSPSVAFTGTVSFSSPLTVSLLTASTGVAADIYAEGGAVKIFENGNASAVATTGGGNTLVSSSYNAILYGTAAVARSAVLYKDTGTDYTDVTGYRRIFVGASQPTGPGLQAGDIWMW